MSEWFPIIPYFDEASLSVPITVYKRLTKADYPLHGHDYYEMEFFAEGSGAQRVNNVYVPIAPGSVFLLSPDDYHRINVETPLRIYSIHYQVQTARQMGFEHVHQAYTMQLPAEVAGWFAQQLSILSKPEAEQEAYHTQELQAVTMQMAVYVLRSGICCSLSKPGQHMQKALKYVRDRHTDPTLRTDDVARECGLSTCYFSSLFHQTMGCHFTGYVMNYRLQHACALLVATDRSVTDIAYETGFFSLSHFFRSFKKAIGCTPAKYRSENQESS